MTTGHLAERAMDLGSFGRAKAAGRTPFTPLPLAHVYVKLDFKSQYESARTADDARGFLRSVARAALAAHSVAERHGGVLMELQGSTLHAALPLTEISLDPARNFAAELHWAYRDVFNDPRSRVEGWRMTADGGKTLVVAGRGVHGDDSWVSLGRSANRPAKHLYAQLELPEERRDLKRFCLAIRNPRNARWECVNLDRLSGPLTESKSIAEEVRATTPALEFHEAVQVSRGAVAKSLPIGPAGSHLSPSVDRPHTYFGWVMRADLDGFTGRVESCLDDDEELQTLAGEFYSIMDAAAEFAARHKETLAQLPWAGDNFTATAVFPTREGYDCAVSRRLIELSLDFEKDMAAVTSNGGFDSWAHGVAGGSVHGNAGGNVYLGGVLVGARRFLVGAGEGFGRSAQAFGDINPKAKDLVLYEPDWERLDDVYKRVFERAVTHRGEQSSLYRLTRTETLIRVRARGATVAAATTVSVATGQSREVAARPYFA